MTRSFLTPITTNSQITSTVSGAGAFRIVAGNYGVFDYSDGTAYYKLLTASGDQNGTYTGLRPFSINLSTGLVSMGTGVLVGNGASFGSTTGASNADYSKHISLWGTTYGLSITGGRLNIGAGVGGTIALMNSATDILTVGSAGAAVTGTLSSSGALTVSAGGAAITGNSSVTGTLSVSGTSTYTGGATFNGGAYFGPAFLRNTGQDGASSTLTNVALSSWYGVGLSTNISYIAGTVLVPNTMYSHWFNTRVGGLGMYGNLIAGGAAHSLGSTQISNAGGVATIDTGGRVATAVTIVSGGTSGFAVNDVLIDWIGNVYAVTAVASGVITGLLIALTLPAFGATPANPLTLTKQNAGAGVGTVTVNTTWTQTTALALNPTGNVSVPNALSTGALTVSAGGAAITGNSSVTGTLSVTGTVSGAGITSLLAPYAPLASPAFTGNTSTANLFVTGTRLMVQNASSWAQLTLNAQSAPTDAKQIDFSQDTSGGLRFRLVNDAYTATYDFLTLSRTGYAANVLTFTAPTITLSGNSTVTGTLSVSGTVSGAGITALHAAPGPIGSTTPSTGAFTTLTGSTSLSSPLISAAGASVGSMSLSAGDATHTGYISFYNAAGVRQGYIGYGVASGVLQLETENGTTGYAVTGTLTASGAITAGTDLIVNAAAGTWRHLAFYTAGTVRWVVQADNTAESGSNAGSNFSIAAFSDAGAGIFTPLSIARSTGMTTISNGLTVTGTVSGAGITSLLAAPGPIGSTTPSSGAFTALSASSMATLNCSLVNGNQNGALPSMTWGLYTTCNYVAGSGETDFFNCYVSGGAAFNFYQRTAVPSALLLASISQAGAFTATSITGTPISGSTGAFTTLSASGTVSGAGVTALLSPYALLSGASFLSAIAAPGVIAANTAGAYVRWSNTANATDQKYFDTIVDTTSIAFRFVNDTYAASNTWLSATRSGYGVTSVALGGGPISLNGATTVTGTLSVSGAISGAGVTALHAAPGPIGSTTPSTGAFTTLSASTTMTVSGSNGSIITGAAATARLRRFQTAGVDRWAIYANNTAEGGSNAGSDLAFGRYNDAGAYLGDAMLMNRATGVVTVATAAVGTNTTQVATTAFVAAANPGTIATIAALRANTSTALNAVVVLGYTTAGDAGMGYFIRVPSDTTNTDNGGTIIVDAASQRWYRNLSGMRGHGTNPAWFGAKPDGTDCAAAINAALASFTTLGTRGHLAFGPGIWTINSAISYTYPAGEFSLTISGQGQGVTTLYWPSTAGISLTGNNPLHTITVRDLTLMSNAARLYVGLLLTQGSPGGNFGQNNISEVKCVGSSNTGSTGWLTDVSVVGWANINWRGCLFYGYTGVALLQNVANVGFPYCIVHNFASCGWFGNNIGLNYGTKVQGVTITQSNFTNGVTAINVPAGTTECSQLAISGSQFGNSGNQIIISGPLGELIMTNNLMLNATNTATLLIAGTGSLNFFNITGNVFEAASATGTNAIVWVSGATAINGVITGNVFQGEAACVTLQTTCSFVTVCSNAYTNCTTKVINAGTTNLIGVATV